MLDIVLAVVGCIVGFIVLQVIGWYNATWDMTDEEKDKLVEYISEHGFYGGDDWP